MTGKLCTIGLFVFLGILFFFGKGKFLIAGYNMLTKEQKERINTKALTKLASLLMFVAALGASLLVLDDLYPNNSFTFIKSMLSILTTLIIVVGIIIIYFNKGNRFRK